MISLETYKHLLPRGKAWRITATKTLRSFFAGLVGKDTDVVEQFDTVFDDLDPAKTRRLVEFEEQFGLVGKRLSEAARRSRLDATWKAKGGQDPRYLQDTLQAAGFNVFIHEYWVPDPAQPAGGSVDNAPPVIRDPFDYLDDGVAVKWIMPDGGADSQDGDALSMDGSTSLPVGYPLVNILVEAVAGTISDGAALMQDGGVFAQDGGDATSYRRKEYVMPTDPDTYPYYLYIGGETFPSTASIPANCRDEFEALCLKICPLEQWLGILVTYS